MDGVHYKVEAALQAEQTGNLQLAGEILIDALNVSAEKGVLNSKLIAQTQNLARVHCMNRDYAKAERMYEAILQARQKVLPANHPDIINTLEDLAVVVQETRGKAESVALKYRALALRHEEDADGNGKRS